MAGSENQESGKLGKRKAKTENFGGGPSSWRGEAEESDGWEEFELEAEEGSQDPLMVFGSEIMTMILGKLDVRSVAVARLVSRGWQALASSDRIWAPKWKSFILENGYCQPWGTDCQCELEKSWIRRLVAAVLERWKHVMVSQACQDLWVGKAHIPCISMVQGLPKMVASLLSISDGKRNRITRDDLCDHVWEFHFTESAPEYWRDLDPYWRGAGAPMRRYFHPDGSITADSDDKVWGGHESSYTIVTGLLSDGKVREHYVRINRWPKMTVHRNPDWSWVLRNHLYCYTSIPDADTDGGTGPSHPIGTSRNLDT